MWECSCVDCVCPVSSVQRHDLIWVPAIFPQGMLATITLMGVWFVLEDLKLMLGMMQDFLSAQWQLLHFQGQVFSEVDGVDVLSLAQAASVPFCMFFLLQELGPFPPKESAVVSRANALIEVQCVTCMGTYNSIQMQQQCHIFSLLWSPQIQCKFMAWGRQGESVPLAGTRVQSIVVLGIEVTISMICFG